MEWETSLTTLGVLENWKGGLKPSCEKPQGAACEFRILSWIDGNLVDFESETPCTPSPLWFLKDSQSKRSRNASGENFPGWTGGVRIDVSKYGLKK